MMAKNISAHQKATCAEPDFNKSEAATELLKPMTKQTIRRAGAARSRLQCEHLSPDNSPLPSSSYAYVSHGIESKSGSYVIYTTWLDLVFGISCIACLAPATAPSGTNHSAGNRKYQMVHSAGHSVTCAAQFEQIHVSFANNMCLDIALNIMIFKKKSVPAPGESKPEYAKRYRLMETTC